MPWNSIILCVNIPLTFTAFQIPILVSTMHDAVFFIIILIHILAENSFPLLYLIKQNSTLTNVCVFVWFAFILHFDQHIF